MERKIVLKQDILAALAAAGMDKGQTVMVHTSLSSLGFVCGGAQVVIEALLETVGTDGTIMMPAQSWKNLDPASGVHWQEPEAWGQLIPGQLARIQQGDHAHQYHGRRRRDVPQMARHPS